MADEREVIADFMNVIQEYPSIYNRSSRDFKDKLKKGNCWKAVADRVCEPVDVVKTRYENIRTQFGKYLKKRKGTSGAGTTDIIPIDPKCERLMWLRKFIVSRPTSGTFRRKQKSTKSNVELTDSDEDEDSCTSSNNGEENSEFVEKENSCTQSKPSDKDASNAQESKTESQQQRNRKPGSKKESRQRQLEKTDLQLNQAVASLNSALSKPQQEKDKTSDVHQLDEDELYALSVGKRFQKLDNKQKALMRSGIERLFLEIEFGSSGYDPSPHQSLYQNQVNSPQGFQIWQNQVQHLGSQHSSLASHSKYVNSE